MQEDQRLSTRIYKRFPNMGPENERWRQFVLDHKEYIRSKSKRRLFTPEELAPYRFRPESFWTEKGGGMFEATWIWMFVNDIREPTQFTESKTQYVMFDSTLVRQLFGLFSASANSKQPA